MRQKTKNHQNQGSIDRKFDFFPQSLTHIPRWVHLVQKTRAKNSDAWAPLIEGKLLGVFLCGIFNDVPFPFQNNEIICTSSVSTMKKIQGGGEKNSLRYF